MLSTSTKSSQNQMPGRVGYQLGPIPFRYHFGKKNPQIQASNFRMVETQSGSTKRPTCPSCSKPARICLCNRLRVPPLDNSVAVTILQHTLEKKHPLNSTRIATLGFKNVDVVAVSDVNVQARFIIRPLESDNARHVFDEMSSRGEAGDRDHDELVGMEVPEKTNFSGDVDLTVGKYGAIINSCINSRMSRDKAQETTSFDVRDIALDVLRKGFAVKKLRMGTSELLEGSRDENEEFEIMVRPGSALLFPSERSVVVGDLNFEVKNLIVLDGTWAKAKRMYNENPWLSMLPHVRLDSDESSLYGEVRHQPKAGYLSTIESIVYAMKAMGEKDSEGLDCLLDVFGSMVGDQRRCKNERLNETSRK